MTAEQDAARKWLTEVWCGEFNDADAESLADVMRDQRAQAIAQAAGGAKAMVEHWRILKAEYAEKEQADHHRVAHAEHVSWSGFERWLRSYAERVRKGEA